VLASALVFDLDGTLVDSQPLIAATVNRVISARGYPAVEPLAIYALVGLPLEDVYRAVLPPHAEDEVLACCADHRALFQAEMVPLTRPMAGARETIETLARGSWRMGVATNRLTSTAVAMLETCGMAMHFETIGGVDLVERPKPYPDLLLHTVEQLRISPEDVLVVGDSGADIAMALAAGATVCAVTWGAQPRETLLELQPTFCIDSWSELLELLATGR
jgi:2-phosphoglycolate phosphatase